MDCFNSDSQNSVNDVQAVVQICDVDEARAIQLLEATNGSVERAIEVYFHQNENSKNTGSTSCTNTNLPTISKKRESPSSTVTTPSISKKASITKTIDSFWGSAASTPKKNNNVKNTADFISSTVQKEDEEEYCLNDNENSPQKLLEKQFVKELGPHKTYRGASPGKEVYGTSVSTSSHDSYNKQLNNRNSVVSAHISHGQYPFAKVARTLDTVTGTSKRTIKFNTLKDLFLDILQFLGGIHNDSNRVEESLILAYTFDLILGKISTAKVDDTILDLAIPTTFCLSQPIPLQVSGAAVSAAILTVTGISRQQLRQAYSKNGDLGDVAANFFGSMMSNSAKRFFVLQKENVNNKLQNAVKDVYSYLYNIATVEAGKGSQGTRQKLMITLLKSCQDKTEIRFVTRMLLGNMRLGATVKTVLGALATAVHEVSNNTELFNHNQPSAEVIGHKTRSDKIDFDPIKTLQDTFNVCPRVYDICNALLMGGIHHAVDKCCVSVGYPIHPMLAEPADSLDRVKKFLQNDEGNICFESVLEWKYDGVRCQAHWDSMTNITKIFSRHLLDNTDQFPDAVRYLLEAKNSSIQSFVIDAEIVAIQESPSFRLLPFQDLSARRGNKLDSNDWLKIRVYCFDIIFLNGVSLLKLPFHERQTILKSSFKSTHGFDFATSTLLPSYNVDIVTQALNSAIEGGAEGLMIKLTGRDSCTNTVPNRTFGYEAGARSKLWLKLKRDYVAGYADTIDVVPIGAWFGSGRKAQKGFLSPILFAVYDDDDGTFKSISRCMSFSDKMYNAMKDFYFHGIPYPSELGVEDASSSVDVVGCDENNSNNDDSDVENDNKNIDLTDKFNDVLGATDDKDDDNDTVSDNVRNSLHRVNCYDTRPSTTIICTNETPTIWFKPLEVFEVSFADLSLSRIHTAASGLIDDNDNRGVAMRFPRFKRRRPDKTVEQATTCTEIASLYAKQSKVY